MRYDDGLPEPKSLQDPALEAILQMNDLTGGGELQRIARETLRLQWVVPGLADPDFPSLVGADSAAQRASRALTEFGGTRDWVERCASFENAASHLALGAPSVPEQLLTTLNGFQSGSAVAAAHARIEELIDSDVLRLKVLPQTVHAKV